MPFSNLQQELQQNKPFVSPEVEAYLNLVRTTDLLEGDIARFLKQRGVSQPQYNVLRILRGAADAGLPSLAVADRMVTRVPDVTRLLDRIAAKGWVKRERSKEDRRVVIARLTPKGLRFVEKIEGPLDAFHKEQLGHLSKSDLAQLSALLVKARTK